MNESAAVVNNFFSERQEFSNGEIDKIKQKYASLKQEGEFCIYLTGSFGRGEATKTSDVDLFSIWGNKTLAADHFEAVKESSVAILSEMGLPELDGDGEFFKDHTLDDMLSRIGGLTDDAEGYFTERMLFLMESKALHNNVYYEKVRSKILNFYFRDLDLANKDQFRPAFLINDVVRYWRTICVNYEEKRTKYLAGDGAGNLDEKKKAKLKLKNKKLKFNRIWLCFTTLIPLVEKEFWTPELVSELLSDSPFERLRVVCERNGASAHFYNAAKNYKNFLEEISSPRNQSLLASPDGAIWRRLNGMASDFRAQIVKIIEKTSNPEAVTYLYI